MVDGVRVAVDLGASSGRVVVGRLGRDQITLDEVHRFANAPIRQGEALLWDWQRLVREVETGLQIAIGGHPDVASVGIDSWAVDHGLLSSGDVLGAPFCYRDQRGAAGAERAHARISREAFFEVNGLQYLPFTTAYQLLADQRVAQADMMLLVPDLLTCHLTGDIATERTNASTTGLLDARTRDWNRSLIDQLGLPQRLFGRLVDPGQDRGLVTVGGREVPLITTASHDTAAAVAATPLDPTRAGYVSLGTWALAGVELEAPVLTEDARRANFTNEGGVAGTTRFLRNVMGTWLLSETLREWGAEADLATVLAAAADLPSPPSLIDVDDPIFLPPDQMATRVIRWLDEHSHPIPADRPRFVRLLVESIAAAIARTLHDAARLSAVPLQQVHVVGGGSQNALLCQLVADHAQCPVVTGPVEATAIGNLLGQAGYASSHDLERGRALVASSTRSHILRPRR